MFKLLGAGSDSLPVSETRQKEGETAVLRHEFPVGWSTDPAEHRMFLIRLRHCRTGCPIFITTRPFLMTVSIC
jgi:hypothetical protein